jgi:hypothetical protein
MYLLLARKLTNRKNEIIFEMGLRKGFIPHFQASLDFEPKSKVSNQLAYVHFVLIRQN